MVTPGTWQMKAILYWRWPIRLTGSEKGFVVEITSVYDQGKDVV